MLLELLNVFSSRKFQRKLSKTGWQDLGLEGHDQSTQYSALVQNAQEDVFHKYGLVNEGLGVRGLTETMTSLLDDYPSLSKIVAQICRAVQACDNIFPTMQQLLIDVQSQAKAADTVKAHPKPIDISSKKIAENEVQITPFSRSDALSLQQELLACVSAPPFQKQLSELFREHCNDTNTPAFQDGFQQLLKSAQLAIIPLHGFEASEKGITDMLAALKVFEDDADVFVNDVAIQEALRICPQQNHVEQHYRKARCGRRPRSAKDAIHLLQALFKAFSSPLMQSCVDLLKQSAAARSGGPGKKEPADGYYHLPGRAELALEVQKEILPMFGFEGSREGVKDMIQHCSRFLCDPEVAILFDATNAKLGMTHAACLRFRTLAESLAPTGST